MALAQALKEAPRTLLVDLALHKVGMGNLGMAALASVIQQGRMQRIEMLDLSGADYVTDVSITALAQAIEARGLPNVRNFKIEGLHETEVTAIGFDAIARALVKRCPQLKEIYVECPRDFAVILDDLLKDLLRAAGRTARVSVRAR